MLKVMNVAGLVPPSKPGPPPNNARVPRRKEAVTRSTPLTVRTPHIQPARSERSTNPRTAPVVRP